jgi:hypothetical protein
MGLGFGTLAHLAAPAEGAKPVPSLLSDTDKAAILTANQARHMEDTTAPGRPVTDLDRTLHAQAMRKAIDDVLAGRPAEVGQIVQDTHFAEDPARSEEQQSVIQAVSREAADAVPPLPDVPDYIRQEVPLPDEAPPPTEQLTPASPPELPKPSLDDPEIRAELLLMRNEAGWAEIGGRMIRAADTGGEKPEVVGRTKWIPRAPWWIGRPEGMTEKVAKATIDKAIGGEPLKPREQQALDYMMRVARDDFIEPYRQMDEAERAAIANHLADVSLDVTPRNIADVDAVARAVQTNEAAVEAAAVRHSDDVAAFMAEVRRINDAADNARSEAPAGGESRGATPRELEAERAAAEAEASARTVAPGAEKAPSPATQEPVDPIVAEARQRVAGTRTCRSLETMASR